MCIRMLCPGGQAQLKLTSRHAYQDGRDIEVDMELVSYIFWRARTTVDSILTLVPVKWL